MKYFCWTLMLMICTAVQANAESYTPFTLGYIMANVSDEKAREEGIGSDIKSIDLGLGYKKNHLRFDGYVGYLFIDDEESFSQTVVDSSGDVYSADSSAAGVSLAAEFGPTYQRSIFGFDLMFGWSKYIANRSISDCSDCDSDNISIPSSWYIKPRVHLQIPKTRLGLSASYSLMTGGSGVENSMRIGLTFGETPY